MTRAAARQFCSRVSRSHGEDPVGFAVPHDRYLLVEQPTPWTEAVWDVPGAPTGLPEVAAKARATGLRVRLLAFAPEPGYSEAGVRRVMFFRKPEGMWASLERLEYRVPEALLLPLVEALLDSGGCLSGFDRYRQDAEGVRDLMVCTHGSMDVCCAKFGYPVYDLLKHTYASEKIRVWRVSHFGGHRFAPTLLDLPTEHYWAYLTPDVLEALVTRSGEVAPLRSHYRGWAGVDYFGQVAEREAFLREGWAWLDLLKRGEVLEVSGGHIDEGEDYPCFSDRPPQQVGVRLHFESPDGNRQGRYEAEVVYGGTVETLESDCGVVTSMPELASVHQYRVGRLERTERGVESTASSQSSRSVVG